MPAAMIAAVLPPVCHLITNWKPAQMLFASNWHQVGTDLLLDHHSQNVLQARGCKCLCQHSWRAVSPTSGLHAELQTLSSKEERG